MIPPGGSGTPDCQVGSIGLLDECVGGLFSSDVLYAGELIDACPSSNVEHYRATMERFNALDIRVGHVGHGPSFDAARKRALVRDYLRGRWQQGCPHPPT
jgi:glyoxylase-like metal-dependent hydrolase (beta-lactamase superfamily II)